MNNVNLSKRRKFVADGVFYAELNELLAHHLAEEGCEHSHSIDNVLILIPTTPPPDAGCEVRQAFTKTEVIIRATHTQEVLGEQGRRIRQLRALVQSRFGFPENGVELYAEKTRERGLDAATQCASLKYKLLNGLAVRRACYGVIRFVMESGAKGVEVVVSGKLRAARAKSMKFTDGFMIHSGQPARDFVDQAVQHVLMRQGVLGIKVKIMKGFDPEGRTGPSKPLPDVVTIMEPKEEAPNSYTAAGLPVSEFGRGFQPIAPTDFPAPVDVAQPAVQEYVAPVAPAEVYAPAPLATAPAAAADDDGW